MTRRERLERKLEKRQEWAGKAKARSDGRYHAAHSAVAGIPPGQPILVGHHSERRHRRALEKCDNAMRKGIEESELASHHASKAGGIERQLETTIFSDDPDAVEALEAKLAKLEKKRETIKAANRIIRRKPKNEPTVEKVQELSDLLGFQAASQAQKLFEPDFCGSIGFPSYVLQNLGGNIARVRKRIEEVKAQQERSAKAEESGGTLIESTPVNDGREWVRVTFEEKPDRSVLVALKDAGFRWGAGSWSGYGPVPTEVTS